MSFTLETLEAIVAARAAGGGAPSYTRRLLDAGPIHCAKKLGEEGVETALAGALGDREGLRREGADLLFHFLVLLRANDVTLAEVLDELSARTRQSGLEEKASRGKP